MSRLIAFGCLLSIAWSSPAQSGLDSLLHRLKVTQERPDKMLLYGKVCWALLGAAQPVAALPYADSVRLMATHLGDSAGVAKSHYYYGVISRYKAEYSTALDHLNIYLQYHARHGDSSRVAGALYQIGVVHAHYGNYEKSLSAYYRSLAIEEADNNRYSVGYTLNVIGVIMKETGAHQDAISYYNRALAIFDSLDARTDKTDVLVNLGNVYSTLGNFNEAKRYYRQALEIDRAMGKARGVAFSLANLAYLFDKAKVYDSALIYHKEALAIREKLPSPEDLARSLIGVGRGYLQLKKLDDAKPYLLRALDLTREIGSKPMQRDVHRNLVNLYEAAGNHQAAMENFKRYEIMKDSILNEEIAEKIKELETKYNVSEKDRQITLLAREREIQASEAQRQSAMNKAFIAGLILAGMLIFLSIYAFRQRLLVVTKDNKIKEMEFRRQLSELEVKALRAQINPHFLFNCLNSINRMIVKGEKESASLYLRKFSKLVRQVVENVETNRVSLNNELTMIESYIQLEELRFRGRIGYEISVDENIEMENTFLPPMILQPLVENAIWHGLMHKATDEKGYIKIAVKEHNDVLLCTIEDNGVGRSKSEELKEKRNGKAKSIGIKVTEERLRLLSRERIKELIRIVDLKDTFDAAAGTRVEVSIPLS